MIKTCKLKLFIYEQLITAADTNAKGTYRKKREKERKETGRLQQHYSRALHIFNTASLFHKCFHSASS